MNDFTTITTDRLILKILNQDYVSLVLDFLKSGKSVFELYESTKTPLYYTTEFQTHILKAEYEGAFRRNYLRYYIFQKADPDKIIGTVSFGSVLPEPFLSCNIGYKISPSCHNMGYGYEAISSAIKAACSHLNLHKINAYVQTDNYSSIRILEKCGFSREGLCPKSIRVNSQWTDHFLYGLIINE